MDTPQIALIGTEGSGKTVLTAVLAKRFSIATPDGLLLNPRGAKTMKYIEYVWNELQNGRWVPSTPAGQMFELKWTFQYKGKSSEMRIVDTAGQDLRKLYSDEGYKDIANLSEQDKKFVEYVHNSDILIVLVNLGDFIGVAEVGRKIENQAVLKEFLESVQNERRQIAVVFTQYDLYAPVIAQQYGSFEDGGIDIFFQQELPYLYSGHIQCKEIALFLVAAINQTEIRTRSDGKTERVPKRGFTSAGLDDLAEWIGNAVVGEIQHIEAENARLQEEIEAARKGDERRKWWANALETAEALFNNVVKPVATRLLYIVIVIVIVIVCRFVIEAIEAEHQRQLTLRPYPVLIQNDETKWSWEYKCNKGIFDCWEHIACAYIPVWNEGAAGNIRVSFTVQGKTMYKDVFFNKGESKWVEVYVGDLPNHDEAGGRPKLSVP
ncbi:MAG: hypothetical protein LBU65_12275 [Planctomycetaceae bacterium]|jgi:GTPase SAR1 family protein|nr:hypothetical protein [Planctomycetaceae bacterium]